MVAPKISIMKLIKVIGERKCKRMRTFTRILKKLQNVFVRQDSAIDEKKSTNYSSNGYRTFYKKRTNKRHVRYNYPKKVKRQARLSEIHYDQKLEKRVLRESRERKKWFTNTEFKKTELPPPMLQMVHENKQHTNELAKTKTMQVENKQEGNEVVQKSETITNEKNRANVNANSSSSKKRKKKLRAKRTHSVSTKKTPVPYNVLMRPPSSEK